MSYFEDVLAWKRAMGLEVGKPLEVTTIGEGSAYVHKCLRVVPATQDAHSLKLGWDLVEEEYKETAEAWEASDLEEVADGAADLIWVLCGFMVRLGIDLDSVWAGVKRANFAKLSGPRREDGKLLKPPGWTPPNTQKDILEGRVVESLVINDPCTHEKKEK